MHKPMKKLLLGAAMLLFAQVGFGQAVADQAVIPVSVTLNSILRLTVTSGGNIQFVVNTIDEYTNGIGNSTRYTTAFTVASSRDFDVLLNSETADLVGTDNAANTIPADFVGYAVPDTGNGATFNADAGSEQGLTLAQFTIVDASPAGDVVANAFTIEWRLGTAEGTMNAATLLSQSFPADNYVTNVFLVVQPD